MKTSFPGQALPTFSTEHVDVAEVRFSPDQRLQRHEHEESRICVVLSGSFFETVGRDTLLLTSGWSYHLPAGARHGNDFTPTGARCLRVRFSSALHGELVPSRDAARAWVRAGDPCGWFAMSLLRDLRAGVVTDLAVQAFLAESLPARMERVEFPGAAPRWLLRIRECLDESLLQPPGLQMLARIDGVHPMSIPRAFRRWFGCSVGDYVQARRIVAACQALLFTDEPLSSLGLRLGYQDQPHFTRHFRSRIGTSPGRYRRVQGTRSRSR